MEVKSDLLLQVRNERCTGCGLYAECKHVCLTGVGNPNAKLFLVGEAPGREEDQIGRPFVGKAGQLLDSILATFDLTRKDVFISNAVKCRPVNNKAPLLDHIRACRHYLIEEILLVKPTLVLALGATAMKSLLQVNEYKLGENRGAIFYLPEDATIPILGTYHPAGILRNNEWLTPAVQDFEKALGYVENGIPEKKDAKYFKGVAGKYFHEALTLDVETTSLNMFSSDERILCLGTCDEAYKAYCTDDLESARKALELETRKVGHNLKFDWKWLYSRGYTVRGPWFDTLVAAHMLNENLPAYGLKELVLSNTDMGRYSEKMERAVKLMEGEYAAVPASIREKYCAMDVDATHRLYDLYYPQLREQGLWPLFQLTMQGEQVMASAEYQGVKIDEERREYLQVVYSKRLDSIRKKIRDISGDDKFNPQSSAQLGRLLTGKMGFPILKQTKEGKVAVDKEVLAQLLPLDKTGIIDLIQRLRITSKLFGIYLSPKSHLVSEDGRVHATFKIHGAVTGRYSCVDPNLQQVPKKSEIKSMFVSKFPGGKIVQVDYDQGELRMLAQYCHDPLLLDTFKKGQDIHAQTAASVFGKGLEGISNDERAVGKTVNFAILYGIGDYSLGKKLGVLPHTANKYISNYFKRHKKVNDYIQAKHREIIETGEVTSLYGRKRRIVVADYTNSGLVASAKRQAANSPIQGALHETNVASMVAVARSLQRDNMKSHYVMEVHDAGFFDCPADEVEEVERRIKAIYPRPDTSEFGFEFDIPLPVSISSGSTWKEASDRG